MDEIWLPGAAEEFGLDVLINACGCTRPLTGPPRAFPVQGKDSGDLGEPPGGRAGPAKGGLCR